MSLSVLSVAYPLAPCGIDAAGGAEQILTQLDRALVRAGHRSVVIACEGSSAEGTLIPTPRVAGTIDDLARIDAHRRTRAAIRDALTRWRFDVVHLHGVDFHAYLPPEGPPVVATLHLPSSWYPAEGFRPTRRDVWLVPVSRSQARACPPSEALLGPVENGVDVEAFSRRAKKRRFALALGRICPEKCFHLAAEAAKLAAMPLAIAGELFPYPAYVEYFERALRPWLDQSRRYIGPAGFARKRRLLAAARCLVIPSQVAETSSLVAMEAMASGTPVVAFRSGALPEIVEHGRTGFVVDGVAEMADAMQRVEDIDPEACRSAARTRFTAERMASEYFELYRRVANREARRSVA